MKQKILKFVSFAINLLLGERSGKVIGIRSLLALIDVILSVRSQSKTAQIASSLGICLEIVLNPRNNKILAKNNNLNRRIK